MKRIIAVMVALFIFLIYLPETEAAADIKGDYFEIEIRTLIAKGIMEGYEDGTFKPSKNVTRAEFTKLIVKSMGITSSDASNSELNLLFTDVNPDDWYYETVNLGVQAGIIKGYPDQTFGPGKSISRQEMATMLNRSLQNSNLPQKVEQLTFKDSNKINKVFLEDVQKIVSLGIMNGNTDNTFKPQASTTRGQVAAVLTRMMNKINEYALHQTAKQRIMVKGKSKTTATVQLQELEGNKWVNKSGLLQAVVGKNGFGKTKEGDGKTPNGTYKLGTAFGYGPKLSNLKYPYRNITSQDYWVDDVHSTDYNKWVTYSGNPHSKWKSFERMNHTLYRYGVVIRYNEEPIVKGKGSAIFLHTKKSTTKHTLGCIALDEKDIVNIIEWLKEEKNPIIVIE